MFVLYEVYGMVFVGLLMLVSSATLLELIIQNRLTWGIVGKIVNYQIIGVSSAVLATIAYGHFAIQGTPANWMLGVALVFGGCMVCFVLMLRVGRIPQ